MKNLRKFIFIGLMACAASVRGAAPGSVRWTDEAADTLRIQQLLDSHASLKEQPPGQRVGAIAREFIDTPYVGGTLEGGDEEQLTVSTAGVDCTTLMEMAAALARTIGEGRTSWHDFTYNLEQIRYRRGTADGFASRLHYISDWIIDNSQRGLVREVTADMPGANYEVKTIDFMGRHRDLYPAMKDDKEFERVRSTEIGYRSHRYPIVKSGRVGKALLAELKEGDIVAFASKKDGLDVAHIGIITMVDGEPRLLHASSKAGKVVIESRNLPEYLRRNQQFTGIRVIRLCD